MKTAVDPFNTKTSRFVKQHLGTPGLTEADTEALQQEVVDLRQKCARLEEENLDLKARVSVTVFPVCHFL